MLCHFVSHRYWVMNSWASVSGRWIWQQWWRVRWRPTLQYSCVQHRALMPLSGLMIWQQNSTKEWPPLPLAQQKVSARLRKPSTQLSRMEGGLGNDFMSFKNVIRILVVHFAPYMIVVLKILHCHAIIWASFILAFFLCVVFVHMCALVSIFTLYIFLGWPQVGNVEECPPGTCLVGPTGEEAALPSPTPTIPALPHHGDYTTPARQPPTCWPRVCIWAAPRRPCQPAANLQHGRDCLGYT